MRLYTLSILIGSCPLWVACGETVNYDTREKPLVASLSQSDSTTDTQSQTTEADGGTGDQIANPQALCAGATWIEQKATLSYPELAAGKTCNFGQAPMGTRKDGAIRAYLEQVQSVTLPEGAILCGFSLTHSPQTMKYDDEMFFLLNGTILLATKDYSEYFPASGAFRRFSWEGLRDQVYDQFDQRPLYCAGGDDGFSTCQLPPTDTKGSISLELTAELSEKLAVVLGTERKLDFSWITTGDNDDSDCRHSAIDLDVSLQYILPPAR